MAENIHYPFCFLQKHRHTREVFVFNLSGHKSTAQARQPPLLHLSIWIGKEAEWLPKFTVLSQGLEGMLLASVGTLAPCPSQAWQELSALPWIPVAGSFPREPVSRVSPFLLSWQYWMCWH